MKVYVQTDIGGIAGFCFQENRRNPDMEDIRHRCRMYKRLTDEVNAAVKAAFDEGARRGYGWLHVPVTRRENGLVPRRFRATRNIC